MNRLLPILLLVLAQTALIAVDALKPFDKTQLTAAQQAACAAFKSKAGQERRTEAKALNGIFTAPYIQEGKSTGIMHPTALITSADITDLLGKPNGTENGNLTYNLGAKDGDGAMIISFDKDGHLAMLIFLDL